MVLLLIRADSCSVPIRDAFACTSWFALNLVASASTFGYLSCIWIPVVCLCHSFLSFFLLQHNTDCKNEHKEEFRPHSPPCTHAFVHTCLNYKHKFWSLHAGATRIGQ